MDRGYTWFALNNAGTDYVDLSRYLARSIKKHNTENKVCVITDQQVDHEEFDHVVVLKEDHSQQQEWKLNNEWQVFELTPFKHTIKLEADMLFTDNTDWWWHHLHQHNLMFSYDCRSYNDSVITRTPYRNLFDRNGLPNVYSAMTYFRKSRQAQTFYNLCKHITMNWEQVRDKMLVNCHDKQATTDVVYALALKIMDPMQENKIDYEWFKFMHNKPGVNKLHDGFENDNYLYTMRVGEDIMVGSHRQSRVFHYHNKALAKELYE